MLSVIPDNLDLFLSLIITLQQSKGKLAIHLLGVVVKCHVLGLSIQINRSQYLLEGG